MQMRSQLPPPQATPWLRAWSKIRIEIVILDGAYHVKGDFHTYFLNSTNFSYNTLSTEQTSTLLSLSGSFQFVFATKPLSCYHATY